MFESVLDTNFDAVSLMKIGRFDESMYLLKLLLTAVQNADRDQGQDAASQQGVVASVPLEDCYRSSKFTPSHLEVSFGGLFRRAFIFEGSQPLANTDENASLCASVGLFNMALSMHLKGLTAGGHGYLTKASSLYKKVFSVLRSCSLAPTDSACSMLLATVLNLIACESEIKGQDESTRKWKQVFTNLMAWATQFSCAAVLQQPEEVDIFAASSVFFASQNFCTAAAA